jgi:hypothetical protein
MREIKEYSNTIEMILIVNAIKNPPDSLKKLILKNSFLKAMSHCMN